MDETIPVVAKRLGDNCPDDSCLGGICPGDSCLSRRVLLMAVYLKQSHWELSVCVGTVALQVMRIVQVEFVIQGWGRGGCMTEDSSNINHLIR